MVISATVQTDIPQWIRETTTHYSISTELTGEYLDYPFDYAYDFGNALTVRELPNPSLIATDFIMTIFGYVQQPTIYIGGHEYTVGVTVGVGEHLTINSVTKTIVLHKANGEQVNCFNDRNKDSYIFEKIPVGVNTITSPNQDVQFTVTLLEERSEPRWI